MAAAVSGCEVLRDRWVVPHFAVRTCFDDFRWLAKVSLPVQRSPLRPASWLPVLDKSRGSKAAEVQRVWDVYDDRLQFMSRDDALSLDDSLVRGDVSSAWLVWSSAVEAALDDAYRFAGGPVPDNGLVLGRCVFRARSARLGGPKVRKARRFFADPQEGGDVSLYHDVSTAPLLVLRRRFRLVAKLLSAMIRDGVSLARSVELAVQWDAILRVGPIPLVSDADFVLARTGDLGQCYQVVLGLHRRLSDFLHAVLVRRREVAIRGWRDWLREDPLVNPYKWLRPDLVPPAPFLQCDPALTPGGSGVLSDPMRIDEEFQKAWLPYFCPSGRRETNLEEFAREVGGWLPVLPEVELPRLSGSLLAEVVRKKNITAGGLDGWGWREFKVLPVSWFDGLARILSCVEDFGVWPDGLLDAYIAMIPKVDGDVTPLVQRPLGVLPVVYRILPGWVSWRVGFGLGFLIPSLVLVVVAALLRLGIPLRLILRRFFMVLLIPMFTFLLLMLLSPLIPLIGVFWIWY